MTRTLARRLARLEAAAAQGEFRHLTMAQLQDLVAALERQIESDEADGPT